MTLRSFQYIFTCAILFISLFKASSGQLYEDEVCRLNNGDSGKCKMPLHCPVLKELIASRIQPVVCSFNQSNSIVCCPENATNETTTQLSHSVGKVGESTSSVLPMSTESPCTMDSGSPGMCKSLQDCPEANTISSGKMPKICHFEKLTPIVCCPLSLSPTSELPPRRQRPNISEQRRTTTWTAKKGTTPATPGTQERSSITMCQHYAQFVFEMIQSPSLFIIPYFYNESQCNSEVHMNELPLRGNGSLVYAQYKEFPHLTRLGYGNESNIQWNCAGSLISENFILTAAGCITSKKSGNVRWASIGDLEPTVYSPNTKETQRVAEWMTPPGSRPRNSLALLRLERHLDFRGYRRPACLYSRPSVPTGYRFATTAGWGMESWENSMSTSGKLMKEDLVFSSKQCRRSDRRRRRQMASRNRTVEGGDICVTYLSQVNPPSCVGGLGSPLAVVLETPYCMVSILGVNTGGSRGCPTPSNPAHFTRVSDHIDWIESQVWT